MAARGLVNGRGPLRRSGRDLVFKQPVLYNILFQHSAEHESTVLRKNLPA